MSLPTDFYKLHPLRQFLLFLKQAVLKPALGFLQKNIVAVKKTVFVGHKTVPFVAFQQNTSASFSPVFQLLVW